MTWPAEVDEGVALALASSGRRRYLERMKRREEGTMGLAEKLGKAYAIRRLRKALQGKKTAVTVLLGGLTIAGAFLDVPGLDTLEPEDLAGIACATITVATLTLKAAAARWTANIARGGEPPGEG